MTARAALLIGALLMGASLAGCATAAPEPVPEAGAGAALGSAPDSGASPAAAAGPSDWAVAIVGTPFVFAFRTVVCAATAVVAGPTAGLLAFSDERDAGLAYLRSGLAQNCGPPYVVPVPVAAGYEAAPELHDSAGPDVGQPRPLRRYSSAAAMP